MAMKIIFMGTPNFAVPILKRLSSKFEIIAAYTQPPKKKSRGQKIIKSAIQEEAEGLGIPVRFPENLNNEIEYKYIKESKVKFVIVVAYGKIIPEKFLKTKDTVFLNIHASLLPRWRGAAPIQRSIIARDKETGISIMKIISKLDAGPYLLQKSVKIDDKDNFLSLSKKLSNVASELILDALDLLKDNKGKFIDQKEDLVTYAEKINKKESVINWNESAEKIIAKVRGLGPYPGVWFKHNSTRIKIIEAEIFKENGKPGEVMTNDLVIACAEKAIKINLIQKEGKKALKTKNFLAGYKINKGEILK